MQSKTETPSELTSMPKLWWLLVIGGIAGAIFGYLLSLIFVKPLYSAQAGISVVINFYQVGHLDQYEQDQYIGHVISFLRSEEIFDQVVQELDQRGFKISAKDLREYCFIDRYINDIFFRCMSDNPENSQVFAQQWEESAFQNLVKALEHARRYQSLLAIQSQIEKCLELSDLGINSSYICETDPDSFNALTQETETERALSRGIFPGIAVLEGLPAFVPSDPIRQHSNLIVLSATLFGFLVSLIFIERKRR